MAGHLRKDGLCDKCKLSCGAPGDGNGPPEQRSTTLAGPCKFHSRKGILFHCPPCDERHDYRAFPDTDHPLREPGCLSRFGSVQLCEHVHVSWSDVEEHMRRWGESAQKDQGWLRACLLDFAIECRDPSHDARCTNGEPHTRPRARLEIGGLYEEMVFLTLEWKPHSGLGKFTRTPDGQSLPSELRELFKQYRKATGGILLPSYASGSLPEIACYEPDDCCCLQYDPGSAKTWSPARRAELGSFFREDRPFGCLGLHRHQRHLMLKYSQQVAATKHWPRGADDSVCVVANYETRVRVFDGAGASGRLNPSHEWLHAMDPDTYPRPAERFEMPLCRDRDCMNYYRRPKVFRYSTKDYWLPTLG